MQQYVKIEQHRAIIKTALKGMAEYDDRYNSPIAEELILATGAHESRNFDFVKQYKGEALSFYQIERISHDDNWVWLRNHPELAIKFLEFAGETVYKYFIDETDLNDFVRDYIEQEEYKKLFSRLTYTELYAVAHSRLCYFRRPFKMPHAWDTYEMAKIWKEHYNTKLGAGTVEKFVDDYEAYIK